MATLENYPNLQSTAAINKLMETADYIEREIAASRRLYNSNVTLFNKAIFVFPKSIMASALKYSMMPLIEASEEQKKDVNLSF
jgi:LemA protein